MGTNTQVCWHKFTRYWDVEQRDVPLEGTECVTNPERAAAACDENTIGVVCVLGSTFTGDYENVVALSAALDRLQETTGLDIPIHVDGASGGFVAPFIQPICCGIFSFPASNPSTLPATNMASSIPASVDRLARSRRYAFRPRLQRGLPRRLHAHPGYQLLPPRQPDRRAVLQPHPSRQSRLPRHSRGLSGGRR